MKIRSFAILAVSVTVNASVADAQQLLPPSSGCTRTQSLFGENIRCPDGNQYKIKRESSGAILPLNVHTRLDGNNSRTGASWRIDFGESITGPFMKGHDQNGSHFHCTRSSFSSRWRCR